MDLHKFAPGKYVANFLKAESKSGTNMVNATFVAFIIFTPYVFLGFHIFATYLQGANLCKSIFSSSRQRAVLCSVRVSGGIIIILQERRN